MAQSNVSEVYVPNLETASTKIPRLFTAVKEDGDCSSAAPAHVESADRRVHGRGSVARRFPKIRDRPTRTDRPQESGGHQLRL
jgi:hypothetical protein